MPHFECGAFDHSATSPGAITGGLIGPRSSGVLGEDGEADKALAPEFARGGISESEKGGTARRDKNRRSHVASLKLWPGSAASPATERQLDGSDPFKIGNAFCVLT